ncbi:hypothetical protein SNARM312S_04504 [Streptomyces narbonensis]
MATAFSGVRTATASSAERPAGSSVWSFRMYSWNPATAKYPRTSSARPMNAQRKSWWVRALPKAAICCLTGSGAFGGMRSSRAQAVNSTAVPATTAPRTR